jgi:hypothetical protein
VSDKYGYIGIETLLNFCSNDKNHCVTPNDFMRMNRIKIDERPHGECKTCKHFVKGGLDGKTYVCEHPDIVLDDHFDYACIEMNEDDFCSRYVPREGDPDDQ